MHSHNPSLTALTAAFSQHFQQPPSQVFQAPGRVNLLGEHTDYNDGFVLPCAIDFYTWVAISERADQQIAVLALDYQQQDAFLLTEPITPHSAYDWANYVRGVVSSLLQQGYLLQGANIAISGNVPKGAGLSSSASLEIALGLAFSTLNLLGLTGAQIARHGQFAEHHFAGCQCGIMDQLISALGQAGNALLIDTRSLSASAVPIPAEMAVLIINSKVQRGLVDSAYNERRQQCEQASQKLGLRALRDISAATLQQQLHKLSAPEAKRARHVVTENERTMQAAIALQQADFVQLSQLMAQSHASMRDDFEITVPAIDFLVELVHGLIGERGGVRMTGGGFGGCVVALLPSVLVAEVSAVIQREYPKHCGLHADIFVCQPSQGAVML